MFGLFYILPIILCLDSSGLENKENKKKWIQSDYLNEMKASELESKVI